MRRMISCFSYLGIFTFLISMLATVTVLAGGLPIDASEPVMYAPPAESPNHFEVIGALGIAAVGLSGGGNMLGVTTKETDRLERTSNNVWDTFAAQLGLGYVYYFNTDLHSNGVQWFPAVEPELNAYYLSDLGGNSGLEGDVWRACSYDPKWKQLTYEMPISNSIRLMFDAALTVASWKRLSLYAKGGLGVAWNRMSYNDTDNPRNGRLANERLNLNANTRANFAWELGAGLNLAVNDRVGFSLEYLYADLGKASPSAAGSTGDILEPQIVVPGNFNLRAQTVLLGVHIAL